MVTTELLPADPEVGGIVVTNVARSFGDVHAVRDASFVAVPGTVTGLIGPNGSGKTTLMLMLASLLKPDAGSIRIAGYDPFGETAEVRSRLGWMPDVLGSWATISVRDTLTYAARMYAMDKSTAAARAAEILTLVDLGDLADSPTRVLSRGQKQRLSLGRALVHDPAVLLLDEPASGLDPVARAHLRTLVRRLASEGKTLLVSSHVLSELDEMADGAVYLSKGVTASAEALARSRATARPWRIRSSDVAALRAALIADGIADEAIATDRTDLLVAIDGEAAASELLARLVGAGVAISTFAPAVGDLEHAFIDLSSAESK
ncbi:ABC transporter ATP-binding protein [Salinibacterium sp. SWN1162]|uniref:ABC transporter ATP-binding protein n=1 Tax=Salinibacterium sp. SWN1162 TaxID=2792053 RepID=UPI0018CEF594|nr:ABC transporter ATP-binding protein [Salinibacterium sp. SWN1162]MBH0008293.1 ABC transporter ATP-binding protein [Salinibacterium sp. SWN1162]